MLNLYWTDNDPVIQRNNDAACMEEFGLSQPVFLDQATSTHCEIWNGHNAS